MKKQTKGILAFAFLGGLMLTSGVLIAIPGFDEDVDYAAMNDPEVTITGTPADIFLIIKEPLFVVLVVMPSQQNMLLNI